MNHHPPVSAAHLAFGRDVLDREAQAILQVRNNLDTHFDRAVEAVLACRGHVIVCGVGKPWFVAQKISATFASTGTASFPLHPSEAVHGDIGRVRAGDAVIMLSNSGESDEILRIVPLVKQFGATLIALTQSADSPLGREADICVATGPISEACPLGLAPSASSTAMLALGDALALAVLRGRPFSRDDYARFHPAGALGRKLLKVREIMRDTTHTPVVRETETVAAVLAAITKMRAGAALIVDADGRLAGIFTDGDLRRHLASDPHILSAPVGQHMTRQPRTIGPDRLAAEALRKMRDHRIDELPVVADATGVPVGHVDVQDLLDIGLALED